MVELRDPETAAHEAAHVVVGVALGLRLRAAELHSEGRWAGVAWFTGRSSDRAAWATMYAAGVAHDRGLEYPTAATSHDRRCLRALVGRGFAFETHVRLAAALLAGLRAEHAAVTAALLERDLTHADLEVLSLRDLA